MKKIFAYIMAVAALASCATNVEDVVVSSATLTAPMEVSVAGSRAFDADLNWSWENSDVIAAYQNAGGKSVNALTLNEAGNFSNNAFAYATEEESAFHFVYPASQLAADYSLTAAQTGVWTPVLYGTAESATVATIGAVEMNYLSSAFEVRVWAKARSARKSIVKAVLTSADDFVPVWSVNDDLNYTEEYSGKELSLDLNSDTVVFNLGSGEFVFTLTLTDANGEEVSWEVPAKEFYAGYRTILNVEWKTTAEASVTSWYEDYATNKNTTLEGGVIYVNATGGTPVVTVDGVEKAVVDGKVSGIASGSHNVVVSINGNELVNRSIVVTSIPSLNATVRTSYSNNGTKATTNDINGTELQVTASLSDASIPSNLVSACQVVYDSNTANIALGSTSKFTLAMGQYSCTVKATLGNGYVCSTPSYTTHVTGIPYHADWRSKDYSDWKYVDITDQGAYLQVNSPSGLIAQSKLGCIISPAFHTPDGSLSVKAAIAASTNATSLGNYDRSYIYAGNRNSSASESGTYVTISYTADFGGLVTDAELKTADATFSLTSSNPCMVFTGKDYKYATNTYILQVKITY